MKHVRLVLDVSGADLSETLQNATKVATVLAPFGRIAIMKGLETVSVWFMDWEYDMMILEVFRAVLKEAAEQCGNKVAVYETDRVGRAFKDEQTGV